MLFRVSNNLLIFPACSFLSIDLFAITRYIFLQQRSTEVPRFRNGCIILVCTDTARGGHTHIHSGTWRLCKWILKVSVHVAKKMRDCNCVWVCEAHALQLTAQGRGSAKPTEGRTVENKISEISHGIFACTWRGEEKDTSLSVCEVQLFYGVR